MDLPRNCEDDFWNEIKAFEKEKSMPFMTTPERIGEARGKAQGVRKSIVVYGRRHLHGFSDEDERALELISDADRLTLIFEAICETKDIEVLHRKLAELPIAKPESD
jgi:hypothetical protein